MIAVGGDRPREVVRFVDALLLWIRLDRAIPSHLPSTSRRTAHPGRRQAS